MTGIRHSDENRERGFSLAALIVFMTALSIMMAAAVPAYQTQAQRELEEELIFRGEEYIRAIQKYQRRFGIYPPSIDALMETNGVRFLRRAYTDPITGEPFRTLTVNPDGTINGSLVYQQQVGNADTFRGGTPQMFGAPGFGQAGPSGQGAGQRGGRGGEGGGVRGQGFGGGFGAGANPGGGGGQRSGPGESGDGFGGQVGGGGSSGFGAAISPSGGSGVGIGTQSSFGASNPAGFGETLGATSQRSQTQSGFGLPVGSGQAETRSQGGFAGGPGQIGGGLGGGGGFGQSGFGGRGPQAGFGGTGRTGTRGGGRGGQAAGGAAAPGQGGLPQEFGAGGVVGVAPTNDAASLMVYNTRENYSEWEFIAIPGFSSVPAGFPALQGQQPGAAPGTGSGQPNPFGANPQGGPRSGGQASPTSGGSRGAGGVRPPGGR